MARSLFRPLFADFWLKVSALIISLGIWFYANSRLTEEMSCLSVLEINPPQGYALVHQSDKSVRVTIAGPRSLISRLDREFMQVPLRLTANLREDELTDGQATLKVEDLWQRADIPEQDFVQLKFRGANPGTVRVFASRVVERTLPVRAHVSVELAPGFQQAASPTVTPPEVVVRGAAVAVADMRSIDTDELLLPDVRADVQQPVGLRTERTVALPTGEQVTVPIQATPPRVTVSVSVSGEELQEQRFPNVRLLQLMPRDFPYRVELAEAEDTVAVIVKASPTNLRKLQAGQVQAYVDLAPFASDQIPAGASAPEKVPVQVLLPPGIAYAEARAEPDRVNVLLKNVPR
jgi:YbbR domain-containing protein